ncbi:MAG: helix-hairpin-helix domain-containing protein [Bacilli bacterium]|nr:helix-hairpin-helix domain-containing protein [Bacilli bacterium]
MTFKYRYRKQILIGSFLFLILGCGLTFIIYKFKDNFKNKSKDIVISKKLEKKENKIDTKYQVDIKGEVNYPGIYKLDINSRVIDVIKLAGDLTENADTSVINLSKKINDEMVIIIYSKQQVEDFKKTKEVEKQVQELCIQADDDSLKNDACIDCDNSISGKININTAGIEELKKLSGVGDKKAKDIINYREKNGLFEKIEDIMKVSGIGENAFAQIKKDITV